MYQFNSNNPPEVNVLILDQMTDDDLIQFCQTDTYATELCSIPKIQNRINNYKFYKTFDISTIFDDIENYCPYPLMIHRYARYEDDNLFIIDNDIHILYQDKYVNIKCFVQEDLQNDSYININVVEHPPTQLKSIINSYESNEGTFWDLDLLSICHIYNNIGLKKYAQLKALERLNEHKNLQLNYQNYTLKDFYKLFVLRLWFLSHVILYKLEDDSIDNFNLDISDAFVINNLNDNMIMLNDDIDDFYDMLYNYINQL